ncbi:KpsF/GutQ family sugar-phosphate isomerase [Paludisphaera borealis]|uniref:Arabinose 5-phosphate isomerase KpsF n=1 Tax=Paludisphaera borealis TaxID=1387353 RepID=A0A1U7CR71_9BACT|nr:KpsF/GutQ family sugar-phosphate isomerase [Paludisphaera borealis]APW61444.1 Arabinose 5-phosphate isomerase KpsF [Paludisphaera borealis]MDR3623401.1 KpsF/GutQ family sugar-phosphate isomerase [Paludisphaera borealis]
MAMITDASPASETEAEGLAFAREVLRIEAEALTRVRERLNGTVARAAELIHGCEGSVIVTGMGKAGLVGQKMAATLASTGTRAFPLHPAEAVHGDLGRIRADDVVVALSQSGETEEVLRLLPTLRRIGVNLVAVTERGVSSLGRAADLCIELGPIEEACPLGLAPSASTTVMMAVGDALALLVSRMRAFSPEDFALYHPAGNLGRKLMRVEDVMRTGRHIRRARVDETVREVFVRLAGPRRRSGAVLVEDAESRLLGIFTDSDLVRLFEKRREGDLDRPIGAVMTAGPYRVAVGSLLGDAVELMKAHKISELPVVDYSDRLAGLIDVTDLIGFTAADFEE